MAEEQDKKKPEEAEESKAPEENKASEQPEVSEEEQAAEAEEHKSSMFRGICTVLGVILAALTLAAIYYVRPAVERRMKEQVERRKRFHKFAYKRGWQLYNAGNERLAFRYFQESVMLAEEDSAKAEAGREMGFFLTQLARHEPHPYGIMAEQYLNGALTYEKVPRNRLAIYQALIKVGAYIGDESMVVRASKGAVPLAKKKELKAELFLNQVDSLLKLGIWPELNRTFMAGSEFSEDLEWALEFIKREADFKERTFRNEDWYGKWRRWYQKNVDNSLSEEQMRVVLKKEVLELLARIAREEKTTRTLHSVQFRTARIYFEAGDYAVAEELLGDFLMQESGQHVSDALLMLTKLARIKGRMGDAEVMISRFLERFAWNKVAADEFLKIIDEAVAKDQAEKALKMIQRYKNLPSARDRLHELLLKGGEIAAKLGKYEEADKLYAQLTTLHHAPVEFRMKGLLGRADSAVMAQDYVAAKSWLIKFANKYPFQAGDSGVYFKLLDIGKRDKVPSSELIKYATTAIGEAPENPRTLETMVFVAKELENAGLPGIAQEQYNRLALLHWLGSEQKEGKVDEKTLEERDRIISESILGNARCLMKIGDYSSADRLLRGLCQRSKDNKLRSEAAYWWGTIAMRNKQNREAARRFSMVNEEKADPSITLKAMFENMLLEVTAGEESAKAIKAIVEKLEDVDAVEHRTFVRRAYSACFERLAEEDELNQMKALFKSAVEGSHSKQLPLWTYSLKLGTEALDSGGIDGFIDCMLENSRLMKAKGYDVEEDTGVLLELARNIKDHQLMVEKYM